MSFNQVENAFLSSAIEALRPQWNKVYGPLKYGRFDIGNPDLTFMIITSGV
jgi:hypothetical protein